MTANELAYKLMESNSVSWGSCTHEQHDNDKHFKEQAATMLRQQTQEIAELRESIKIKERDYNFMKDLAIGSENIIADKDVEIESLKKELALQKLSDIGQEIENEPVAWRFWGFNAMNEPAWVYSDEWNKYYPLMEVEPLYTHPMRELTDEEIRKVADEVFKDYKNWHHYQIDFARAILKKASEK
jgi:hypothetical protein